MLETLYTILLAFVVTAVLFLLAGFIGKLIADFLKSKFPWL